jgi:protein-tyrosine-phosphatase
MTISSAGLWRGLDPDNPRRSPEEVRAVAREFGVSLDDHRSMPVTAELVARHDLIIVMDYANEATMLARFPECRDRLYLLGACVDRVPMSRYEIPDPWGGGPDKVRDTFSVIQRKIVGLAGLLSGTR